MEKENELYECDKCHLHYSSKELARKCSEWCSTHTSCNLEVIKFSVEAQRDSGLKL